MTTTRKHVALYMAHVRGTEAGYVVLDLRGRFVAAYIETRYTAGTFRFGLVVLGVLGECTVPVETRLQ